MASSASKRSVMTLYSGSNDMESHRTRIVLAEKGVLVNVIETDHHEEVKDLHHLNPYNSTPTLVDRDLVLYDSHLIMEYLDERFPHPPLLPVYPIARAKSRLIMLRIDRDLCPLAKAIQATAESKATKLKKELKEKLLSLVPAFAEMPFFLSEEFSLVDCCLAPLLWRLPSLGIELPKEGKVILSYAKRMFERTAFKNSLTETEQELKSTHATK